MSQRRSGAKHRAERRPVTPLTSLGQYITGPIGRRTAAAAASTGIVFTLTAAGSLAAPATTQPLNVKAPTALTVSSTDGVAGSSTVSVDEDTGWSFMSAAKNASATPPPAPVVRAAPVVRTPRAAAVSRTGTRAAAPAAPAAAPAPAAKSPAPAATGTGSAIVAEARKYVGTPYVHGGGSPGAFDCSGFTSYVFSKFGANLPRSSGAQRGAGRIVSAAEARPGDLVWWPGHIGIYTGNGNHIAARNPSTPLYESKLFKGGATYIRVIE